jgi:hypothetical protein
MKFGFSRSVVSSLKKRRENFIILKGPCHEIFNLWLFSSINTPIDPWLIPLNIFGISFQIRGDIRKYVLLI